MQNFSSDSMHLLVHFSILLYSTSGHSVLTLQFLFLSLQVHQKPPAGHSRQPPGGGSSGGGGGSSNGLSDGEASSSTRASPASTIRAPTCQHGRPALASNFSLDDITTQLEKVKFTTSIQCCKYVNLLSSWDVFVVLPRFSYFIITKFCM